VALIGEKEWMTEFDAVEISRDETNPDVLA
jgi:hypothetical protein